MILMDDPLLVIAGDTGDEHDHHEWSIEDVLTHYGWDGHFKRFAGSQGWRRMETCPFHGGGGGASVNDYLNSFRCFACGAAGNSVTLVMQQERLDAKEAVEWLQRTIGNGTPTSPRSQAPAPLPWEPGWNPRG